MRFGWGHLDVTKILLLTTSLLLFILWGAFFLEHMTWFVTPGEPAPPADIWLLQISHAAFVVGYLVILKWERMGMLLILAGSVPFFISAAGDKAAAFILFSNIPVFIAAFRWWKRSKRPSLPIMV